MSAFWDSVISDYNIIHENARSALNQPFYILLRIAVLCK